MPDRSWRSPLRSVPLQQCRRLSRTHDRRPACDVRFGVTPGRQLSSAIGLPRLRQPTLAAEVLNGRLKAKSRPDLSYDIVGADKQRDGTASSALASACIAAEQIGCIGAEDDDPSVIGDATLLHKPRAQSSELGITDRARLLQPTELVDFICDGKANRASDLVPRLPNLLRVALRHAPSLKDQVCEHENEWKYDPSDHPYCLDPAGDVVTSEQIGGNRNEQPEPHDEEEYREDVEQKISIGEALLKEDHRDPPVRTAERKSARVTLRRDCAAHFDLDQRISPSGQTETSSGKLVEYRSRRRSTGPKGARFTCA